MKIISVPLSKEAMERLDRDCCVEGDLKELELSQEEFDQLWSSGFFKDLSTKLGVIIDDFEDERIPSELLDEALGVIDLHIDELSMRDDVYAKL